MCKSLDITRRLKISYCHNVAVLVYCSLCSIMATASSIGSYYYAAWEVQTALFIAVITVQVTALHWYSWVRQIEWLTIENLHKVKPNELYYYGNRSTNIKHAQLRMKCSRLNAHLYNLHVVDSPGCSCGHDIEDNNHYLLICPLYHTLCWLQMHWFYLKLLLMIICYCMVATT